MIEIESLSVAYGASLALQDISLSVAAGEILAVIGPNGAGKSTLIRAISGIIPALSGNISVAGTDLTRTSPAQRARYLAVVPQASNLPAAFSVYHTVLLGRTPYLGWLGQASPACQVDSPAGLPWRCCQANRKTARASTA